jgi:hypothetical protein
MAAWLVAVLERLSPCARRMVVAIVALPVLAIALTTLTLEARSGTHARRPAASSPDPAKSPPARRLPPTVQGPLSSKIVFGVLFLLLAVRNWRTRPKGGAEPEMPKWMAGIDTLKPVKALGLGLLLAGVNPKNLMLAAAAGAGLAALGLSSANAIGSLIVFVVIASATIAGPVAYYLLGGDRAKAQLDEMKNWLALHNNAVMAVLFLVFGAKLIADGLPPLT